jgi:hypothetical protein
LGAPSSYCRLLLTTSLFNSKCKKH